MIDIGEKPILWHIMKNYSYYGFNEFVICLGYKGYCIKEYFAHYFLHEADLTFDFTYSDQYLVHSHCADPWRVTLVNTGLHTMTGGRVKKIQSYVAKEPFLLTYGDGVANVDIKELVAFHQSHGKLVTMTAVQPKGRFGVLEMEPNHRVSGFQEKPRGDGQWVNGGFFVMNPGIFDYIEQDNTILEQETLPKVAREGELVAYQHHGFWYPMDTLRDKNHLEELWNTGQAPWKVWG
jgi:glucose-1-phosphate cytidylyltransferase